MLAVGRMGARRVLRAVSQLVVELAPLPAAAAADEQGDGWIAHAVVANITTLAMCFVCAALARAALRRTLASSLSTLGAEATAVKREPLVAAVAAPLVAVVMVMAYPLAVHVIAALYPLVSADALAAPATASCLIAGVVPTASMLALALAFCGSPEDAAAVWFARCVVQLALLALRRMLGVRVNVRLWTLAVTGGFDVLMVAVDALVAAAGGASG